MPRQDDLNAVTNALGRGARSASPWQISEALGDLIHLERANPRTLMAHAHLRQAVIACAFFTYDGRRKTNVPLTLVGAIVGTLALARWFEAALSTSPAWLRVGLPSLLWMLAAAACMGAALSFYRNREWTRSADRLKLVADLFRASGADGVAIAEHLDSIASGLPRPRRVRS